MALDQHCVTQLNDFGLKPSLYFALVSSFTDPGTVTPDTEALFLDSNCLLQLTCFSSPDWVSCLLFAMLNNAGSESSVVR